MNAPKRIVPSSKIHYGWYVASLTFCVMIISAAVRSAPGILIVPLENEFGWSRESISFAISLNIFLYGMLGPFAAALMNRFGIRKIMFASLILSATGVGLATTLHNVKELTLYWGIIVGIGTGLTAGVLGATVVQRWFHTRQGLVMGLLTASSATGQLIFLTPLAWVVEESGWRSVTILIASALLMTIPFVYFIMKDSPADKGLRPYGLPPESPVLEFSRKNPLKQAFDALKLGLTSRDFYLLGGSFFICGASTNGLVGTHLIPACHDHGIPEVRAASLLALMGICDLLGTSASGWLTDRFDSRKLLLIYYGLRGLSLLFLPSLFQYETSGLPVFAVFYGLDWIATVPPTLTLVAKSFGREKAPLMFGWIMAIHQAGAASATYFAGLLRTDQGSYDSSFLIAGSLCLATAGGVLLIGRGKTRMNTISSST